jgi:uncharacterized protein (DUF58 family)
MRSAWKTRLRRWLRPPRQLSVTASGRTFLILSLGVGFGALNTGNNLLYLLLGLQLATIVASGLLSEACLRSVTVRRLLPAVAHAQEPFRMGYALARGPGRSFALVVHEAHGPLVGEACLGVLEGGREQQAWSTVTAPRRGPLQLTGIKVSTVFPFGLFKKTRTFDDEQELLVYPKRVRPPAELPEADPAPLGSHSDRRYSDGDGELHSLRPLAQGEDARRVHWIKSAQAGTPLRVLRERETRASYTLTLASSATGQALEAECEGTAAQVERLLAQGHDVGLRTHAASVAPGRGRLHQRRLFDILSRVGF